MRIIQSTRCSINIYFDSLKLHLIKFSFFLTKYIFLNIAINILHSYIATAYLLIDYDFTFDCRFICPCMVLGSIHQLSRTTDWLAIDIDTTLWVNFTKVYRVLSQEKRIKRDIRMVPTIKHDFVRRGSQRESFRVVKKRISLKDCQVERRA